MFRDGFNSCTEGGHGMFGNFMGSGMMIIWILVIGALAYYIVTRNSNKKSDYSALEILEKEFARGNIEEEEFIRKRDLLK